MVTNMTQFAKKLGAVFSCNCHAVMPGEGQELPCGFSNCAACNTCPHRADDQLRTHQYGMQESIRWGGSYIYYCPKGLTFFAQFSTDEQGSPWGVVLGPVVLGQYQDLLLEQEDAAFAQGVESLKTLEPDDASSLSDVVAMGVLGVISSQSTRNSTYDQAAFLNELYTLREQQSNKDDDFSYIFRAEAEMKRLVKTMDKPGMQKFLNELLGRIYLQNSYDLEEVKTRCVELTVLLSQTVMDSGVEMGRIFHFSTNFLQQVSQFQTIDALCAWMSDILHGFIDAIFSFSGVKHADAVYKTMGYIRKNWQSKPSLDEIARHVYLSKSYLSMVFKQEVGIGISEFINQIRVDHSKKLLIGSNLSLAAIAVECGFHDQSYYTKVFQKNEGISPKKYRNQHMN